MKTTIKHTGVLTEITKNQHCIRIRPILKT